MSADAYERHKADVRRRKNEMAAAGRDIAPIPAPVDNRRRGRCRRNFKLFCQTYAPDTFSLGWSPAHLKVIKRIERAVLHGGLFAMAMPRGSGKSTLSDWAVIWSAAYGHHEFTVLIGSDQSSAEESLDGIKQAIEGNDLLCEDFPAMCYPVRRLEGIANRAAGQTCNGQRTQIEWTANQVVLPTVDGAESSASIITVAGITGRIRGMKFTRPDGRTVRPSLVIVDDPQTDESAYSATQCAKRERILSGAILGLAGPGRKISGVMPCTVIRPGDMADRILNRSIHPDWQGERTTMLDSMPDDMEAWEEYWKLRCEELEKGGDGSVATEWYGERRQTMDAGASHYWPERFNHDELSAIQNAMNLFFRDEHAFRAEYQNDPLPDDTLGSTMLTAEEVAAKLNGLKRLQLPLQATTITGFVDIQLKCLYYTLVAWAPDFTGWVIDYGTFPDQRRSYFTLRDVTATLQQHWPDRGLEGQLYQGLGALSEHLFGRQYIREDGAELRPEIVAIDANWAPSTDVVYQFCRSSSYRVIPAHGRYVGASSLPMSEYRRRPGERSGLNWLVPSVIGKRAVRHVKFDTNFWKTFVQSRLAMANGEPASLTLFGREASKHQLFAEHMVSEYYVRTEGRGRSVEEWKQRPEKPDNHWWDGLVGSAMLASMAGCSLTSHQETTSGLGQRNKQASGGSFAERQRRARERKK